MIAGKKTEKKNRLIVEAITEAEKRTSSEIHVHLSHKWKEPDPFQAAGELFHLYGLYKTRKRNAVLFYINIRRRKFAVIGDREVDRILGQAYWNKLAQELKDHLKAEDYEVAIANTIKGLAEDLHYHFPVEEEMNVNELPNQVTEAE